MSPDGRHLYIHNDRGFADEPPQSALSTRAWSARVDGLGDIRRVPMRAVFEALGCAPR